MGAVLFDPAISDEERRALLYAGDVVILSATAGTRALSNLARQMLEDAFAPHDPRKIHELKTAEDGRDNTGKSEAAVYPSSRM